MESSALTPEDYKALEATRLRLMQISSAIGTLKANVLSSNPLPNLESLQNHADILQGKIQSVLSVMMPMADTFNRIVVHPSTNFPGRTQEQILLQLLRKKPEPDVATAMGEGRKIFAGLTQASDPSDAHANAETGSGKGVEELEAVWASTREFFQNRLAEYVQGEGDDMFTEEERARGVENVRTGLKRSLLEDEDEEEDDSDDDVMEIDRPPPPPAPGVATQEVDGAALESVMRFAARGEFVSR
ncbi:mediator of RNA polymerase II transcription complex subunit 8-domain-containing protein [Annulohypoxylon maeteangense]|uniref:mediator of RNA polymerase II transcription complex subunit 8-domain-containing protein n=1 Tax=Annulohypoxylon maeteangense TaxID=1927788 RepID=UPI002007EB92|nr:mediator of RNA polymerase II transcription complex subunit 8-domain-containing protein [Annulohypoxylon maeteangense]KAI0880057.1 mediator of RNA polymerase II transcription complex subunit 8-domain-containing protein [Annulohypoxylon maeteangense]